MITMYIISDNSLPERVGDHYSDKNHMALELMKEAQIEHLKNGIISWIVYRPQKMPASS